MFTTLTLHILHHLVFEIEIFKHRLHHHVDPVETGVVQSTGQQAHLLLKLTAQDMTALEFLGQNVVAVAHGIADPGACHILDPHRYARLGGGDECDAAPHQTTTQHGRVTHLARLGPLIGDLFLHFRGGKEDRTQGSRLDRHNQLAEVAGLGGEASLHPLLHTDAHHVQDPLRRGVVTTRLAHHPFACLIEQHLAAKLVGLQQLALQIPLQLVAGLALLGQLDGGIQQDRRRYHIVHQPQLFGLLGAHLLAGQHQIKRLGHPDKARQALGTTGSWQQTKLYLGQTQHGFAVIGHHSAMTGQRQLQPAAEARAVNSGDHRDGQ